MAGRDRTGYPTGRGARAVVGRPRLRGRDGTGARALPRDPEGAGLVFVEPKTQRSRRTIPLPRSVASSLRAHRTHQLEERAAAKDWADSRLVFASRVGTPLSPRNDYRAFRALAARAGLRPVRLHDLRHTAASLLLSQGVPARVVMEVLGHSQISVTLNTYSHVAPSARRRGRRADGRCAVVGTVGRLWLLLWLLARLHVRFGPAPRGRRGALTWGFGGAACRNRTDDLLITSEPLYRLS